MYAKVIVDVPAGGVDRTFDYRLKEEHINVATAGMRVLVPFGARKQTGFITEITSSSTVKKVKSIHELLDVTPVLNGELLELGQWLAKETICFQITAFQAMIPAAMRAKAQKQLHRSDDEVTRLPMEIQALFGQKTTIDWKDVPQQKKILTQIQTGIVAGQLRVGYKLKDSAKHREQKAVRVVQTDETPSTDQQKKTLNLITKKEQPVAVASLINDESLSRSTIQTLVKNGFLIEEHVVIERNPYTAAEGDGKEQKATLTTDQTTAVHALIQGVKSNQAKTMLLHGVTGSGKTEVYLQAIEEVIHAGKEAIVLVPEISLTPQMVNRFKRRFGDAVAVMHSALSTGERYDEWMKIQRKEVQVVVGARSAVFAPFEDIGLIVIDEEHESSYKQEDYPRYHAREVAIRRSENHQCPVLLGSATPALESYARALKGVYQLLELPKRVNEKPLPDIHFADLRDELRSGNRSVFSKELLDKIKERLERKEQTVLFLNRRGFSTFVMCRSCGFVGMCLTVKSPLRITNEESD
ncbi:helicase PriA [Geomicrobium sp. JCM 19037]|nr:helicase PriA [Geomicrobium sp. JCM 19037]